MTFKERLDKERDNHAKIILFNDGGLFFNLVERSAYAFHTRIKPFKVHVKTLKGLDEPFVSIGVPVEKIDEYLQGLTIEADGPGNISAHLPEPIDENAFLAWKKHIIEEENVKKATASKPARIPVTSPAPSDDDMINNDDVVIRQCFQDVNTLNIASMTPMEAMLYLNSLQQKLKNLKL